MQKSRASFTVFFEDPFWVGVYEREEPGGLTACRVVFGAEPKDGEIYEWMLQNWAQLHFGPPLADARRPRAENPACPAHGPALLAVQGVERSAQQALALARGAGKQAVPPRAGNRSRRTGRRFALRVQRRKRKSTGQVKTCPLCFSDCRKKQRSKRKVRGKSWRWQSHASLRSKVQTTRRMPPKRGGEALFHLK